MTAQEMQLAIAIATQVLTQGPAIITSIAALFQEGQTDPTAEQIRATKIDKAPEEFFKEG